MTPLPGTPPSVRVVRGSRRPHKKSRSGCSSCKKRKVKVSDVCELYNCTPMQPYICFTTHTHDDWTLTDVQCDEKRPLCSGCVRHSMDCEYPIDEVGRHVPPEAQFRNVVVTSVPVSSTTGRVQASMGDATLHIKELELFHNYATSIALSISPRPFIGEFWRTEVPRMGFTWPFILHGMFALSGIHLARFKNVNQDEYRQSSSLHWHTGLRMATTLLPQINEDNCHALYIFAVFSCLYSFAQGPRPGEFLLFSDNGTAEWLSLFRGIVRIAQSWQGYMESSPLGPIIGSEARELNKYRKSPPEEEPIAIRDLKALLVDTEFNNPDLDGYLTTLSVLSSAYAAVFDEEGTPRSAVNSIGMLALFRVSESEIFATGLQQRQPIALVIFAYFVVLVKQLDFNWMTDGWVNHLMTEVHRSLTPPSRRLIAWPMQKLGWIPSE